MAIRILLADADRSARRRYGRYLAKCGFEVQTAASGLEAVAGLRTFQPDLLVLDPKLPWGGGEGVVALMYEDESVPLIPVIVLSTRRPRDGYCIGVFPVSAYYVKPLAGTVLVAGIRGILSKRLLRPTPDAEPAELIDAARELHA